MAKTVLITGSSAITRLLPDAFWRPLLAEGMKRRPKHAAKTEAP